MAREEPMRHLITFVIATFALSSNGMAAELPKSGSDEGRFYSHGVERIDELETADGMKSYVNESFIFYAGKQPGGLLDRTTERCLGYGRYSETGAVKEIGRCTILDSDGDKLFEEYEVEVTGKNDKSPGKGKILGGTGKYKGIRGTLTFVAEIWPELSKVDSMWAGDYKREYKIGD
jgi:hypothetical protein